MLEHTLLQDATTSIRPTTFDQTDQTQRLLSAERQAQVDACLDHLCSRAVAGNPDQAHAELRVGMQLRLEQLVAAHQELGGDLDSATVAALQQIRQEYTTSTTLQKAKTRTTLFKKHPSLRPTLLPLSLFSSFYAADVTGFAWRAWAHIFGIGIDDNGRMLSDGGYFGNNGVAAAEAVFYRFELFLVPLLVGLVAGLALRRRADRAVLNALMLMAVFAVLLPGMLSGLCIAGVIKEVPLGWSFVPGAVGAGFWITLGYGGTKLGSWLGQRGNRLIRSAKKARSRA